MPNAENNSSLAPLIANPRPEAESQTILVSSLTKSRSTFESITFRAVIVFSLLCVISGGAMIYIGSSNAEFWREAWRVEVIDKDKRNSPEFKDCMNAAIHTEDGEQTKRCYALYAPNSDVLGMLNKSAKEAQSMVSLGLMLCVLPVPLFVLFFVLRWILTGRWKKTAPTETEGNKS